MTAAQDKFITALRANEVWAVFSNLQSLAPYLGASTLVQLDEGDLGRGSCLRGTVRGRTRDFRLTYWEPQKALILQYQAGFRQYSYHFRLQELQSATQVEVRVRNDSTGLWRWLVAIIVWQERRRLRMLVPGTLPPSAS